MKMSLEPFETAASRLWWTSWKSRVASAVEVISSGSSGIGHSGRASPTETASAASVSVARYRRSRAELVQRHVGIGVRRREAQLQRHADLELGGGDADDVAHQSDTLVEFDQAHDQRVVERRHLGIVRDGVAVERGLARCHDPVVVHRSRARVGVGGRMDEAAVVGEALDPQFVLGRGPPSATPGPGCTWAAGGWAGAWGASRRRDRDPRRSAPGASDREPWWPGGRCRDGT